MISHSSPIKVALIEDDPPTRGQLKAWISAARPGIQVDEWDNRDDAQAAVESIDYAAVVLDIELGMERHAGVAIINAINKNKRSPVLVVSAMPAALYRSIFKALDAWDYLQKTTFTEQEFIETFLELLRAAKRKPAEPLAAPAVTSTDFEIDPLKLGSALWRGQRLNIPLTAQRILASLHDKRGELVTYEALFEVIKSGRNKDNVRKHVAAIREALKEIDPTIDPIENVPMRGFRLKP